MYIKQGSCCIELNYERYDAVAGQIILIDCYKPHSYYSSWDWEALWLHFDGISARAYYDLITSNQEFIFTLKDTFLFTKTLNRIYDTFHKGLPVQEALISQSITTLLTELLVRQKALHTSSIHSEAVDETIQYISEHLKENLTLPVLSSNASLSPFYFSRLFKKETGFTPHQYIMLARINHAKFLLKNTMLSIKEIAFEIGFSSESRFCTLFKTLEGGTPSEYRSTK